MTIAVHENSDALVSAAASRIRHILANIESDNPSVCLTGGGTAAGVYRAIAAAEVAGPSVGWQRFHFFWGDERDVPPDHPDSNYRMAMSALLAHVPVNPAKIHRMEADGGDASAAALKYDALLRRTVFEPRHADPAFDLMLLGLGDDAHIASLFPGSALLTSAPAPLVAGVPPGGKPKVARITLTPPAILAARRILMIVSGASKAEAVHAALDLPEEPSRWPVQILRLADDRVEYLIDSAAAQSWRGAPPAK